VPISPIPIPVGATSLGYDLITRPTGRGDFRR